MPLEAIIYVSIGFAVPFLFTAGILLWARHDTKELDAALQSVGYRK